MTKLATHSGLLLNVADPSAADIDPRDIAHALSHLCRFNGHTRTFYSVAQHACMVADLVPPRHRLAALLQHAASAYLGLLIEPLRRCLPVYQELENSYWLRICERFQIDPEPLETVHAAELVVTATEERDLMQHGRNSWIEFAGIQPLEKTIRVWNAQKARIIYLQRLQDELCAERQPGDSQDARPAYTLTCSPPSHQISPRQALSRHAATTEKGYSAAQISRSPQRTRLCLTQENPAQLTARLRSRNRAQDFADSPPYRPERNHQAKEPALTLATSPDDWEESIVNNDAVLDEMAADRLLPETVHACITELARRRVE